MGGSDERTLTPISLSGGMTESIGRLTSQGEIGRVSFKSSGSIISGSYGFKCKSLVKILGFVLHNGPPILIQ